LTLDGYADWRLPEIDALVTIVDYTTGSPALSTEFFQGRPYDYWSGSTTADYPYYAWYVNFNYGHASYWFYDTSYNYVRCVRGYPVWLFGYLTGGFGASGLWFYDSTT
jgi:hypothetical protein